MTAAVLWLIGSLTLTADNPIPGLVLEWSLSQSLPVNGIDVERYPDPQLWKIIQWQTVRPGATGLVDIAQYRQPFPGAPFIAFMPEPRCTPIKKQRERLPSTGAETSPCT